MHLLWQWSVRNMLQMKRAFWLWIFLLKSEMQAPVS